MEELTKSELKEAIAENKKDVSDLIEKIGQYFSNDIQDEIEYNKILEELELYNLNDNDDGKDCVNWLNSILLDLEK